MTDFIHPSIANKLPYRVELAIIPLIFLIWAVLKSARDYMQLSPAEQFALTRSLAVQQSRRSAIEDADTAQHLIPRLQRLAIGG